MSNAPSIEDQIAELEANGWTCSRPTVWMSPSGAFHHGPHGAWEAMRLAKSELRNILLDALVCLVREVDAWAEKIGPSMGVSTESLEKAKRAIERAGRASEEGESR